MDDLTWCSVFFIHVDQRVVTTVHGRGMALYKFLMCEMSVSQNTAIFLYYRRLILVLVYQCMVMI